MAIGEAPLCSAVSWYGNLWRPTGCHDMDPPLGSTAAQSQNDCAIGSNHALQGSASNGSRRACVSYDQVHHLTSSVSIQMPTLAKVQLQSRLGPLHSVSTTEPSGQTTGPSGKPSPVARMVTSLMRFSF